MQLWGRYRVCSLARRLFPCATRCCVRTRLLESAGSQHAHDCSSLIPHCHSWHGTFALFPVPAFLPFLPVLPLLPFRSRSQQLKASTRSSSSASTPNASTWARARQVAGSPILWSRVVVSMMGSDRLCPVFSCLFPASAAACLSCASCQGCSPCSVWVRTVCLYFVLEPLPSPPSCQGRP